MSPRLIAFLATLVVVACSLAPRWILHDRTPTPAGESWTVSDPDSLYHIRRVQRHLDGDREGLLSVAGQDPRLNYPEGARIPWPPYYDLMAASLISPFTPPDSEEQRAFIEKAVASLPLIFGILTSLVVFLAARSLAGTIAGTVAGVLHALSLGSVAYSCLGNGDHHALVTLLSTTLFYGLSVSLKRGLMLGRGSPIILGAVLGSIAGLAIGSWVASLLVVLIVDAILAVLLFINARSPERGLPRLGLSFHLAALLVLLPAVWQSPWKEEFPWMVVNLSWFHLAYLGLGALVFLPLLPAGSPKGWRRQYPWIVAVCLAILGAGATLLDLGPAAGIREGFEWVSRQDTFMGAVAESRPLIGEGSQAGELSLYLGWQILLFPLAWLSALVALWRGRRLELLPWVVAAVPLSIQAAEQARFADALIPTASVLTALGAVTLLRARAARLPRAAVAGILILAALLGQFQTLEQMYRAGSGPRPDWRRERAARELCDWTRAYSGEHNQGAVLSNWNRGHEIEWAAERASVATNFGSYVGEEGFLAPARFFLSADGTSAEAALHARDARFVIFSSSLSSALPGWILAGDPRWAGRYFELDEAGGGRLLAPWFESIGGQLLNGGFPRARPHEEREDSLDFMRLVHASPVILRRSPIASWRGPAPYGWVWESVPGAQVELKGSPGEPATIEIEVVYQGPDGERTETIQFLQRAPINEQGVTTLRVPYATLDSNGDGRVERANWRVGNRSGSLELNERDVLEGRSVRPND